MHVKHQYPPSAVPPDRLWNLIFTQENLLDMRLASVRQMQVTVTLFYKSPLFERVSRMFDTIIELLPACLTPVGMGEQTGHFWRQ